MSAIVCDKRMPIMTKSVVYNTVIIPVLMYGIDTRALREAEQDFPKRTEM